METVKNPITQVFGEWSKKMRTVVGHNNVRVSSSGLVASAPFARIFLMGAPTHRKTLDGTEASVTLSMQTDVFSSGERGLSDAYDYDQESHDAMVSMGFRRTYGPELIDNADSDIKRVVSRYSLIYTNAGVLTSDDETGDGTGLNYTTVLG